MAKQEAKNSIIEYSKIFTNRKRRASYLGVVSPKNFEYRYNQQAYEKAA